MISGEAETSSSLVKWVEERLEAISSDHLMISYTAFSVCMFAGRSQQWQPHPLRERDRKEAARRLPSRGATDESGRAPAAIAVIRI
jgi:hypothetical protein